MHNKYAVHDKFAVIDMKGCLQQSKISLTVTIYPLFYLLEARNEINAVKC